MAAQDLNIPSSLPPYSEMIYAAIEALNEKMGSNKTSISSYIESRYGNLPTGHSTLLRHHLHKMKDSGELIFWKNNYMKPDPNFVRRGRGRPPKPKDGAQPPTVQDFSPAPATATPSVAGATALAVPFKKKETRGRPRKYPRPEEEMDMGMGVGPGSGPGMESGPGSRKRGRPPKAKAGGDGEACY